MDLATIFKSETVSGSRVFGGAALTWTDFAVHEDGFGRILVRDISLDHFEVGRLVQRLLEIETYRMMALVALPLVREHGPQISLIEEETAKIARSMSEIAGLDDTRALLTRLSRLSADVERITARLSYRFDATRAYFALVRRRVERLREERLERLQTIEEFMERRLAPAMQTCETAARRLESFVTSSSPGKRLAAHSGRCCAPRAESRPAAIHGPACPPPITAATDTGGYLYSGAHLLSSGAANDDIEGGGDGRSSLER